MTSIDATRIRSTDSGMLKQGEYGYPLGHLGHLTEPQQQALIEFKALCAQKGLYKEATDGTPNSHDDVTLLRFLRARRFVPKDALQQFKETEKWREVNEIDTIYMNIDVKQYDETRALYPQWTGRRDKRGLPVYCFQVAPLNSKTMSAYAKSSVTTTVLNLKRVHNEKDASVIPPRMYRLFALYENLTTFALPFCTQRRDRPSPQTPISQSNNIVDISGVGLKQFWNLRSHMQEASVLATAHYPETLDRIFIVGAPTFFPTVWGWIKRWFDPITTSKIFILSEQTAFKTLSTFIEPENIPTKYGGKLPFVFGQAPILDEKVSESISWTDPAAPWPVGPVQWINNADGTMSLMAVGSVDGKERRDIIATFRPDAIAEDSVDDSSTKVGSEPVEALTSATEKMDISMINAENTSNQAVPATTEELDLSTTTPNNAADMTPMQTEKVDAVPQAAVATSLPEPSGAEVEQLAN